jgi:hypothetical protein
MMTSDYFDRKAEVIEARNNYMAFEKKGGRKVIDAVEEVDVCK